MSALIKRNGRSDDEIELSRLNEEAARRFPKSERTLFKFRVGCDFAKQHFRAPAQNRYENALVCAPRSLDDFTCIDFVVHWQVTADGFAGVELARVTNSLANDF